VGRFDSGVFDYVEGEYTVKVYFPIDKRGVVEIACKHCPFLSGNERICQLNKQPVYYPNNFVGYYCPLELKEREKENEKD
jgi:hypothetical protein